MWAALFLLVLVVLPSSSFASNYQGVPDPPFGTTEVAGPATCFVDSSNPRATDTNNPTGTATRPRRTMPLTLPAGAVVEVRGGPYTVSTATWTANGQLSQPAFVVGVGNPVFTGNGLGNRVKLAGQFLIVQGVVFSGLQVDMVGLGMVLRDSEVRDNDVTAVVAEGLGNILLRDHIHDNGDPSSTTEIDSHGVKVATGASHVWVLASDIHHNGGDAVQIGDAQRTEPFAQWVWIAGNTLHEDRENGVDIKAARDVFVSQNIIWGYRVRNSSAGEAVVVHNNPERVFILGNALGLSNQGVVCTGATIYVVAGNVVVGVKHVPGTAYDPNNVYGVSGILTYSTQLSFHINNTIYDSDAGISIPNGTSDVSNNIIALASQPTEAVRFGSSTSRSQSVVQGNYVGGDPGFANPAAYDFHLRAGSAMIDRGVSHWIWDAFASFYAMPLKDVYGMPRISGGAVDLGAAEFQR